ncbi:MAG: BamA/TamA family outer membrane protein [Cyclobacteriaceae bacterium]
MLILCLPLVAVLGQQLQWSDSTSTVVRKLEAPADSEIVRVDKIFIIGNRRTKERIITREMDIKEGQVYTYGELKELTALDRRKIMNTQLFLGTRLSIIQINEQVVDIIIRVTERWYTIPSPFFRLADRDFNVWLRSQNRDWSRVEYGLRFFQYNFRGLDERVFFYGQLGFTRQLAVRYIVPYIDKAQKNGLDFSISYSENSNVNFITDEHRLIATDSLSNSLRSYVGHIGWSFRPSFFNNHRLLLSYNNIFITDTISQLNPNYFLDGKTQQRSLNLTYQVSSDRRDFVGYPLKGYRWEAQFSKHGLGVFDDINMWRVSGEAARYIPLGKGFFYGGIVRGYLSTLGLQPYANISGLGYGQVWLRGYDAQLIEGQAYLVQQNTLSKRLFAEEFDISSYMPIDQFNSIPLAVYLKAYIDHGYVWNSLGYIENQPLANRYLTGFGVGVDIVSFYDFVLRLEHSWRRDGTSGIFFYFNSAF